MQLSVYRINILLAILKALTFLPVIILFYYNDFSMWTNLLTTENLLGFFVAALGIISIGLWLKRKIIGTYVQISETGLRDGLLLVVAAAAVYISGSYIYQYTAPFHYESLILLIAGYTALRFDKRLLHTMAPLFAIAGVVFAPSLTESLLGLLISGIYAVLLLIGLFAIFEGTQLRPLLIPATVSVLGLA
ncbi:MAG: hypothetical protein M1368_07590, partial [Thaumarchaeota archaeon]|nr:hypothetical protein [Nitrososphaerota archaeon]